MLICILFSFSFLLLPGLPWWLRSNLPAMQEPQEDTVRSLGWKDPLEKSMATHSRILAWRIPWTEEPGRLVHGSAKIWTQLQHLSMHISQCLCSPESKKLPKKCEIHTHTHTQRKIFSHLKQAKDYDNSIIVIRGFPHHSLFHPCGVQSGPIELLEFQPSLPSSRPKSGKD